MFKNSIRSAALMFAATAAMCLMSQEANAQSCGYGGRGVGSGFNLSIGTGYGGGFGGYRNVGGLNYGGFNYGGFNNRGFGGGYYGGGFNRGISIQSYRPSYSRSYGGGRSFYSGGGYQRSRYGRR